MSQFKNIQNKTPKEQTPPASQGLGDPSRPKSQATPNTSTKPLFLDPRPIPGVLPMTPVPSGSLKKDLSKTSPPLPSPSGQLRGGGFKGPKPLPQSFPARTNPNGNVSNSVKNSKENSPFWGTHLGGNPSRQLSNSRPLGANNLAFSGVPNNSFSGNSQPSASGFQGTQGGPNYPQGPISQPVVPSPLEPKSPKGGNKKRLPMWARIAIGLLIFLIVVAGGAFAYYEIALAPSLNNILGKQAIHHTDAGGTVPTGRTNILLLGSDTDGKGNDPTNGVPLAQTILIITVDPQTNYVGMLSIPRDMQVVENGYIEPKLDEVFMHGYTGNTLQDKVASGAGEMEDIIRANFGIHIDHYAWVGLGGFIKVINTAGGVDVDTIHPMVDDTYPDDVGNTNGSIYDYKRLYIAPGPQHLNGTEALDYVRTRHSDLIGDFGRTIRQQQIISQLKTKLATPDTLGKASELLQDLNGAVQTDMQLSDVIGLGNLARNIDNNSVDRLTLGPPDYAVANVNGDRPSNYLPICENIVPKIQKMFNIPSPNCLSQALSSSTTIASTNPSSTSIASTGLDVMMMPRQNQGLVPGNTTQNNDTLASGSTSLTEGVHGLLDILFGTTFESFDAMQI